MPDRTWELWTDEVFATGVHATVIAAIGMLIASALPGWSGHDPAFVLAVALGTAPALLLASHRVRTWLHARLGPVLPIAWSLTVVAAVTLALRVTGDPNGPIVLAYVLPIIYFATLYPTRVQVGLLLVLGGAYGSLVATSSAPVPAGTVAWYAVVLVTAAYLANRLSAQIQARHHRQREAEARANRRAALIRLVIETGDHDVDDVDAILDMVLEATGTLGMECAALFVIDHDERTYTARRARGFVGDDLGLPRPLSGGIIERVVRDRRTLTRCGDDGPVEADALMRDSALACMVAVPLRNGDQVGAVLAAGTRSGTDLGSEVVEAFEMLAIRAENALAHASRFNDQAEVLRRRREIDGIKDHFVTTASHELRTPLTVMKSATELLQARWHELDDDRRLEVLGRMSRHVDRLDRLVETMTRFRMLDMRDFATDVREVAMPELVHEAADRYQGVGEVTLTSLAEDDVRVEADPRLLRIALDELVDNASRHTAGDLRIGIAAADDHVVVRLADDGPGLSPELVAALNDSAILAEGGTAPAPGLGLGLATAVAALDLIDVGHEVVSSPEAGTVWSLQVRRAPRIVELHDPSPSRATHHSA